MDLTTLFCAYLVTLAGADAPADDISSEFMGQYSTIRDNGGLKASLDDFNTALQDYLIP